MAPQPHIKQIVSVDSKIKLLHLHCVITVTTIQMSLVFCPCCPQVLLMHMCMYVLWPHPFPADWCGLWEQELSFPVERDSGRAQ